MCFTLLDILGNSNLISMCLFSVLPLYFLAEGMRVSLVSISSSSEILSTVVRYSITLVSRSGRREISKMCSMYDRLSAREKVVGMFTGKKSRTWHPQDILAISGGV